MNPILNAVDITNELAEAVLHHHENWDGSGYPKGLKGNDIPLNSRIINLTEHYDRFLSGHNGNKPLSKEEVLDLIKCYSGTKFDPQLVELLIRIIKVSN